MADEYVAKEAVLNAIHNGDIDMGRVTPHEYRLLQGLSRKIDRRIQSVPVADVAPVRHGRWIDQGFQDMVCSVCGNDAAAGYDEEPWPTPYCPFCGALMDKEE